MTAPSITRIEIAKEALNFSAAHFTIFSARERENLHGHNFRVACEVDAPVGDDGLCFDYAVLKAALRAQCDALDERLLLPGTSPHLRVTVSDTAVLARFADESMAFLTRDVLVLPIPNISVEGLSAYLLAQLQNDPAIRALPLVKIVVKVSSGSGQWGSARWSNA